MKLRDLYPTLTTEERESLAQRAESDAGYLWQIATQWRGKRASLAMIQKLVSADPRLSLADMVEEFTEDVAPPEPTKPHKPTEHATNTEWPRSIQDKTVEVLRQATKRDRRGEF